MMMNELVNRMVAAGIACRVSPVLPAGRPAIAGGRVGSRGLASDDGAGRGARGAPSSVGIGS